MKSEFPQRYDAPKVEQGILAFWKKGDILRKSIDSRPAEKPYTFYDGPITANNEPHYGHALTMVTKDVMPRFWTMKGYRVARSLGWDCQGIPVEYEVEKTLGFEKKEDIEKFGVAKFNQLCRESVEKYQKSIRTLTERMGRWVNNDEEYATMDPQYIESLWWSLKELYAKGFLYEGHKVVPYSTRAGTSLSNAEVALGGYKPIVDPAITVKFKVKDKDVHLLAWTTTPWTMPGNLMLAVGEQFDYVQVEVEGEHYIVAKERVNDVFGDKKVNIVASMKGKDLVGWEYDPPFDYFLNKRKEGTHKVIATDFVGTDEGTGVVHLAPYGEDDFNTFMKMGIEVFDYLDDTGTFTNEIPEYAGQFYKKANKSIIADMEKKGVLYAVSEYEHQMPMCWRTDTPLIYKPIKSWYVKVTAFKDVLVKENNEIGWVPKHIKPGRFGNWIENARDWALSRSRYWGTPLPVWKDDKTGEVEVIGSFKELEEKSGVKITDPHKPFVDEITYKNKKTGGTMRRIKDVIDVWYDSGAMPFARLHYPFENKEKFEQKFPAQYIAEGIDQTRGWFYTLHVLGGALFNAKAFENVIVNGMLLAADGSKMSKSKRNYEPVNTILDTYGADVLRLFFLSSPIVEAEDVSFSTEMLKQMNAAVLLPYFNTVKYFTIYAQQHGFTYDPDFKPKQLLDRWILLRLQHFVNTMDEHFSTYQLQHGSKEIQPFIDDLSTWYIKRSRQRFVEGDTDALQTLFKAVLTFTTAVAPVIPFMSEFMYGQLKDFLPKTAQLESVHLLDYPTSQKLTAEEWSLVDVQMPFVRDASSVGQALRVEHQLPLKQPLAGFTVYDAGPLGELLTKEEWKELLRDDLNVVQVFTKKQKTGQWVGKKDKLIPVELNIEITPELAQQGMVRMIVREIQRLRKVQNLQPGDKITVTYHTDSPELTDVLTKYNEEIAKAVFAKKVSAGESKAEASKIQDHTVYFTISAA